MADGNEAGPAGQLAKAESRYRYAAELYDKDPNSDPEEHATALFELARTLNLRCGTDEALEVLSRGQHILETTGRQSPFLVAKFAYARGWIGAFSGDFAMARTETERAWGISGSLPGEMQRAALPELGAFMADVEEERGNFQEAVKWLERILTYMSKDYTRPDLPLPFFYAEGVALRLHHAYRIAGATTQARSLATRYGITTARAGVSWPTAPEWVIPAGACGGLARGDSPYAALDDTPELTGQIRNCFVKAASKKARVLLSLLFSPEGRVLAVEGAAVDLDREAVECASRTAMQAKMPPAGRGFRSRHLEADALNVNADYRGL